MPFRLIKNNVQRVAVIGGIANILVSILLCYFGIPVYLTLPFLIVWIMVWLLGSSLNGKADDDEVK